MDIDIRVQIHSIRLMADEMYVCRKAENDEVTTSWSCSPSERSDYY